MPQPPPFGAKERPVDSGELAAECLGLLPVAFTEGANREQGIGLEARAGAMRQRLEGADGDLSILVKAEYILQRGDTPCELSGAPAVDGCQEFEGVTKFLTIDAKRVVRGGS